MTKLLRLIAVTLLILTVSVSCSVEQRLTLDEEGGGVLSAKGRPLPFAAVVFDDLALIGGYDDAGALYDEIIVQTEADLALRPIVLDYQIDRTEQNEWSAVVRFTDVERFLGGNTGESIAELCESEGAATLSIRIDRERAEGWASLIPMLKNPALLAFNPAETVGYDEESYTTDVLGFTFGEENLPAIRANRVKMEIVTPGPVTALEGGIIVDHNTAAFEIPITRLIVPENPVVWSVTWKTP